MVPQINFFSDGDDHIHNNACTECRGRLFLCWSRAAREIIIALIMQFTIFILHYRLCDCKHFCYTAARIRTCRCRRAGE